jgi:hypothetical protein
MLTVAQLAPIKDRDPYLYETLTKIVASVNATSQRAGVDPSTLAPARTAAIAVQASSNAYAQYVGSLPSAPITFGSPPTAVTGGGTIRGNPQNTQRSLFTLRLISNIMLTRKSA